MSKFIKWHGGDECPVNPETKIDIVLRNGRSYVAKYAGTWRWSHPQDALDIVEYKVRGRVK